MTCNYGTKFVWFTFSKGALNINVSDITISTDHTNVFIYWNHCKNSLFAACHDHFILCAITNIKWVLFGWSQSSFHIIVHNFKHVFLLKKIQPDIIYKLEITNLMSIFDESPCLLLNVGHFGVTRVHQNCDLCGSHKTVLLQRPAKV